MKPEPLPSPPLSTGVLSHPMPDAACVRTTGRPVDSDSRGDEDFCLGWPGESPSTARGGSASNRYSQPNVINAFAEVLGFSPVNRASRNPCARALGPCYPLLPLLLPLGRYDRHFGEVRLSPSSRWCRGAGAGRTAEA